MIHILCYFLKKQLTPEGICSAFASVTHLASQNITIKLMQVIH